MWKWCWLLTSCGVEVEYKQSVEESIQVLVEGANHVVDEFCDQPTIQCEVNDAP